MPHAAAHRAGGRRDGRRFGRRAHLRQRLTERECARRGLPRRETTASALSRPCGGARACVPHSVQPTPAAAPRAHRPAAEGDPMTESVFTYGAPQLKFGSGAADEIGYDLSRFGVKRVLVVTDPGVSATGLPQRVAEQMGRFGIEARVYDGVHVE